MAKRLTNLKLDEFSLVRGPDLQPANQECTTAFYKATPKGASMDETTKTAAATPAKTSLAKQIAAAVRTAIQKATTTTTYANDYTSSSRSTETTSMDTPAAAPGDEGGESTTVVVVTDAVEKNAPAAASDPIEGAPEIVAALEPIAKAINALDGRLAKIEKVSTGSRVLKAQGLTAPVQIFDASDQKYPDFTKYLASKSGLSAGQRLTKATLTSSGWSYGLSYVEAGNFIDYVVDQSVLLKLCRTIKMPDKKYPIDKIGLGGNVLVKGTPGTDPGDTVSLNGPSQVQLDASEILAIVSVGDDTLEDNIEGEAFVQHLLGMIARAAANELEQAAIHGDTAVPDAGILDRFDGWLKLAIGNGGAGTAHVIDAMTDDDRYWPGDTATKATRLIKALPTKYRNDFRNLGMILHPDAYLDFSDMLARVTSIESFQSITGIRDLPVRSVRNVQVPMLKTDIAFSSGGQDYTDGTVQILTDLRNLIFGIHRQIKIEPYRQPRKRCTDYVLSMRCAVQVENPDAVSIYNHSKVHE